MNALQDLEENFEYDEDMDTAIDIGLELFEHQSYEPKKGNFKHGKYVGLRTGDRARRKTIVKSAGVLVWEGPSALTGDPIVVIASGFKIPSLNRKTGPMVQVYVLRSDISPITALERQKDEAVCGTCIHRPQKKGGGGRSCYVDIRFVEVVWKAYKRGSYTPFYEFEDIGDPFENMDVRLTTYGDGSAVPFFVWESMLKNAHSWTAYTHMWRRDDLDPRMKRLFMASVDSEEERRLAKKKGWRTFRSRFAREPIGAKEIACPAADEGGKKTQCIKCRLCNGSRGRDDKRRDIVVIAHGSGASWYEAARSTLNARKQGSLPIVE